MGVFNATEPDGGVADHLALCVLDVLGPMEPGTPETPDETLAGFIGAASRGDDTVDEAAVLDVLQRMASSAVPNIAAQVFESNNGGGAGSGGAAAAMKQRLWKVMAALSGLVAELPLGGAPYAAAVDAFADLNRTLLLAASSSGGGHDGSGYDNDDDLDLAVRCFCELSLPCLSDCFHHCPGKRPAILSLLLAATLPQSVAQHCRALELLASHLQPQVS
jgi:hypothetical protein